MGVDKNSEMICWMFCRTHIDGLEPRKLSESAAREALQNVRKLVQYLTSHDIGSVLFAGASLWREPIKSLYGGQDSPNEFNDIATLGFANALKEPSATDQRIEALAANISTYTSLVYPGERADELYDAIVATRRRFNLAPEVHEFFAEALCQLATCIRRRDKVVS